MNWYEESFQEDYLKVYKHRNNKLGQDEALNILKMLNIKKRDHILDLCCGSGRHAIPLAKMGYKVIGVDLSDYLLQVAWDNSMGLPVEFIKQDMRNLNLDRKFDAVLNLFTSFGYFPSDVDNYKVLTEIKRVLRPGGKFIIDYLSPEHVKRSIVPYSEEELNGETIIEKRRIENDMVVKEITISGESGERHYKEMVKLYSLDWFMQKTKKAGLSIKNVYGDFEMHTYNPLSSNRMIITGQSRHKFLWS